MSARIPFSDSRYDGEVPIQDGVATVNNGVIGSHPMPRALKTFLLVVLVALVPLRGLAAATVGLCAFAHEHGTAGQSSAHDHGSAHEEEAPASLHVDATCSSCAEHCSGSAFAAASTSAAPLVVASAERCASTPRLQLGLHAERLDRPPLSR